MLKAEFLSYYIKGFCSEEIEAISDVSATKFTTNGADR